jgi:hypothetical protein
MNIPNRARLLGGVWLVFACLGAFRSADAASIVFYVDGVSGGLPTRAGDIPVRNRLISLGHTVTTINDSAGTAADTVGKDLIVISSSVQSADMSAYAISFLSTAPLPILDYEPALFDELLMGASGNNIDAQSSVTITTPTHPLAAGFTGSVTVYNTPGMMAFGVPGTLGTDATVVATSDFGDPAIFTYDKGKRLSDDLTVAAARRVGFFFNEVGVPGANADGFKLFDTAVGYALVPEPACSTLLGIFLLGFASRHARRFPSRNQLFR